MSLDGAAIDAIGPVVDYHQRSKHYFNRYAPGPHNLDWREHPSPFRRFVGAPLVELPRTGRVGHQAGSTFGEMLLPGAVRPNPIDVESLGLFLRFGLGLSAWKQSPWDRWSLRVNASSGNLHPTEAYVLTGPVPGLADHTALWHYAPEVHGLEERARPLSTDWRLGSCSGQDWVFLVGLSSVHWREAWKYGERAFRYCQHDIGHALASLRFSAATLGWRMRSVQFPSDGEVAALLGLDREGDFDTNEREAPACLAVVTPGESNMEAVEADVATMISDAARAEWLGRAERLSESHVSWPAIDEVTAATLRGRSTRLAVANWPLLEAGRRWRVPDVNARALILQRRSAGAFDRHATMDSSSFFTLLDALLPCAAPPWDLFWWPPAIHLLLFVHRVAGFEPGLYLLPRTREAVAHLREQLASQFEWGTPDACPETVPLARLAVCDARQTATLVSCFQEIAGDSCFSLGMIAEFEGRLARFGPWFYRALFWEAGAIGQRLYLEAEAAGYRGCAIGCFSDDAVHELVGLSGLGYQSLFHFAVGSAIDDPRIETRPAYEWEGSPGSQ